MPLVQWIQENLQPPQPIPQPSSGSAGNGGGFIGGYVTPYLPSPPASTWRIGGLATGEHECSAKLDGISDLKTKIVCEHIGRAQLAALATLSANCDAFSRTTVELVAFAELQGKVSGFASVHPVLAPVFMFVAGRVSQLSHVAASVQRVRGEYFASEELVKAVPFDSVKPLGGKPRL